MPGVERFPAFIEGLLKGGEKMKRVELFLKDLSEEGKQKFRDVGMVPEDMNWDVFPLCILEFEDDDKLEVTIETDPIDE